MFVTQYTHRQSAGYDMGAPTLVLQCLTPSGGCLDGYSYYTFGREA